MKLHISTRAYSKILLHACKYPHKAINGVLIGQEAPEPNEVVVTDSVPLFHLTLGLTPMLEVALSQVDAFCRTNGLQIVGYYQANENLNDNSPDWISYKMAEKISERFPHGVLMMIDNNKMGIECAEKACKCQYLQETKWKEINDKEIYLEGGEMTLGVASDLLQGKAHQSLIDFDNHLDDISQDWFNTAINKLIDLSVSDQPASDIDQDLSCLS